VDDASLIRRLDPFDDSHFKEHAFAVDLEKDRVALNEFFSLILGSAQAADSLGKAGFVERLEQVVEGLLLECFDRELLVSRSKDDGRAFGLECL